MILSSPLFIANAASEAPGFGAWLSFFLVIILAGGLSMILRRVAGRQNRRRLQRWVPATHIAIWTFALLLLFAQLSGFGLTAPLVLAILLLLGVGIGTMGWLRNILSGLVLFFESQIRPGDRIEVNGIRGEVLQLGVRSLRVRDAEGVIHEIPHSALLESPMARFPEAGEATCLIDLELPETENPEALLDQIRRIVGLAPLASPRRRPEAFLVQPPGKGKNLQIKVRAYPASSEVSEAFRSDVLRRIADRLS